MDAIKKFFLNVRIFLAAVLIFLVPIGFGIHTTRAMPPNAKVYVDDLKKVYYAPTYLKDNALYKNDLRLTTAQEARSKKYTPDSDCRDKGYFVEGDRSLTGSLLEKAGILSKKQGRWDSNGGWLY